MNLFDAVVAVLFGIAAVLQVNDPDPLPWIVLYGAVALVAGLALAGRYSLWLIGATFVACVVAMVVTAPSFYTFLFVQEGHSLMAEMSAGAPFVEEAREFLGVLVAALVLVVYAARARRARRLRREPPQPS